MILCILYMCMYIYMYTRVCVHAQFLLYNSINNKECHSALDIRYLFLIHKWVTQLSLRKGHKSTVTKGMVNFMCQLDWSQSVLINIISRTV